MNRLYEAISLLGLSGAGGLLLMGDLVNGSSRMESQRLLREVAALCSSFNGPIRFMHGNHDLDHFSKAEFYSILGCAGDPSNFHFQFGGYTFVCLDGNYSPDGKSYDSGNFVWQQSFVPEEQIDWLRARLVASLQPVVVVSHQCVDGEGIHSVVNHEAVREVIASSGKVKAVLQGHRHQDNLKQIDGTSYYTLGAHVDRAGPAVLQLGSDGVRLNRDYRREAEVMQ